MNAAVLREFLLWCTVLNMALLLLSALMTTLAGGWIFRWHRRIYPFPREVFDRTVYCFLGLYKVLILVFNLVPYIALVIMG